MADVLNAKGKAKKKKASKRGADDDVKVSKKMKIKPQPESDEDEDDHRAADTSAIDGWSQPDLNQLIENVIASIPSKDNAKYSTTMAKIDWSIAKFGNYSAEQCENAWKYIVTRIRRYRTLTEVTNDAKVWAKRPWSSFTKPKQKHPDLPKKPLTPFFRFFLEQRPKLPTTMTTTETAKYVSKKFAELSDKKKIKYKQAYDQEMILYREKLKAFLNAHPEESMSIPKSKNLEGPERPHTPFELYKMSKVDEKIASGMSRKDAAEEIRKMWSEMNDSKRIKWIRKALSDESRYQTELQEYIRCHPNFAPLPAKPILTKAEKELKDRSDGKPERPPPSGYNLFSRKIIKTLEGSSKDKVAKIAQMWKELSDEEREKFNFEAKKMSVKYTEELQHYINSLPADKRAQALLEAKGGKTAARKMKMKTDASGLVVGKKSSPKKMDEQHDDEDDEEEDEEDEEQAESDEEEDSDSD